MFDLIEEAFDQISLSVEGEVASPLNQPVALGRDDRLYSPLLEGQDQAIGVVGLVGEKGLGAAVFQQRLRLAEVRGLPWGQGEGDRIAERVDQGVDLSGQSAAGSADGLVAAVFFRAPALC